MIEAILLWAAGPIGKWDSQPPDMDYVSGANIFDAERCLIDLPGFTSPDVFRQPDRPNEVNILWADQYGRTGLRVHLVKADDGTHVRSWKLKADKLLNCAPPR